MSVDIDKVREVFIGDGVSTSFPTTLLVTGTTDIRVFALNEAASPAIVSELLAGIGYTATLNAPDDLPSTLTIDVVLTYAFGLTVDHSIIVVRDAPLLQGESVPTGARWPDTVIELLLDKVVLQAQQAKWRTTRALVVPVEDPDGQDLELPNIADRAEKVLFFDVNGLPSAIELSELSPAGVVLSTLSQTLLPINDPLSWKFALEAMGFYGSVFQMGSGLDAARPAAAARPFTVYFSTNTGQFYYSNGSVWTELGLARFASGSLPASLVANRVALDTDQGALWRGTGASKVLLRTLAPGHIHGCEISYQTASTFQVLAGWARDEADSMNLRMASSLSKTMNAAGSWTAGAGGNAAPAGALFVANTLYGVFLIGKPDGTCDWGIDTSLTAANLLAAASGYTGYRRIGWIRSEGTPNLVAWDQVGEEFTWRTPQLGYADGGDVDYTTETSRTIDYAPPSTWIWGAMHYRGAAGGSAVTHAHTSQTIGAVTVGAVAPGAMSNPAVTDQGLYFAGLVDSSRQRKFRGAAADPTTRLTVVVYGWRDTRGR